MGVEVDISNERMSLTTGTRKVADWPLDGLDVVVLSDGFHVTVDDEEIVLNVTDSARFATELGVGKGRPTRLAGVAADRRPHHGASAGNGVLDISRKTDGEVVSPLSETTPEGDQALVMQRRIADVAKALDSRTVSPAEAFARWLSLLKEINRRHGQGSMPTDVYYRLNTHLLELIPEPPPDLG